MHAKRALQKSLIYSKRDLILTHTHTHTHASAKRREVSLQPSKLTAEEAPWGLPLYDTDFAALAGKVEEKVQKLLLSLLGGNRERQTDRERQRQRASEREKEGVRKRGTG